MTQSGTTRTTVVTTTNHSAHAPAAKPIFTTKTAAPKTTTSTTTAQPSSFISGMPNLINAERQKAGLPALAANPLLDQSAAAKCADAQAKQYFAHAAPDGTQWYSFIDARTRYSYSGENIAYGYKSGAATVQAWMNSAGHRANILNPKYTSAGYAVCSSPTYPNYVVQHLIAN